MTCEAICILDIKVSGIHMNPDFGYLVFGLLLYYTTTAEGPFINEVTQILTISNPPSVMRLVLGFTLPLPYLHDII